MRNNNTLEWEKTSKLFTKWLINNDIKNYFLKNFFINNFPIWWITDLANKDNVVDNRWFYNLKKVLIDKKAIKLNKLYLYLVIFFKLIKNFIIYLFYFLLIKVFIKKKRILKDIKIVFILSNTVFKIIKKISI